MHIMRYEKIDILRGWAIVLMILFHLNYSLVHIFSIEILNFSEIFWYILWRVSVLGFMAIAWISYFLAEKKYGKDTFKKYWKYSCILAFLAASISFTTYFSFPQQYIKFWILHFFAVSFFLLPFFSIFKYTNILIWISIIMYGIFFIPVIENKYFFFLWLRDLWFTSADYYPLIPYFGVLLLAYSAWLLLDKYWKFNIFHKTNKINILESILIYIGKRSLIIYIIHQPIIVGTIMGINYITS